MHVFQTIAKTALVVQNNKSVTLYKQNFYIERNYLNVINIKVKNILKGTRKQASDLFI